MKSLGRYVVALLVLVVAVVVGFWGLKFLLALVLKSLTATIKIWLTIALVGLVSIVVAVKAGAKRFARR